MEESMVLLQKNRDVGQVPVKDYQSEIKNYQMIFFSLKYKSEKKFNSNAVGRNL